MLREVVGNRAANHHLHERVAIELAHGPCGDVAPIPQHRHRVAELEDLVHPVADVDARHAPLVQSRNQAIQRLGLMVRQAAGRLVEHDDPRAAADRRRNLQHLLLRDAQLRDLSPHVDRGADCREHRLGLAPHPRA